MKKNIVGLIVEYNPFHNGHLYHIQQINEKFKDSIKIAIMSGDFVQRGEPSIINKFDKTRMALSYGVDIVIELPAFYSTQSAELFALGSIASLEKLSCDNIVFGSESDNLEKLKNIANISLTKEFSLSLQTYLSEGFSYPTAFSKALFDEKLKSNDLLALEYLKAIKTLKAKINPITIKREKAGYYDRGSENISSASYIRKVLLSDDKDKLEKIRTLVPEESFKMIEKNINNLSKLSAFFDLIKYEILKNFDNLKNIQDIEIGFENRLFEFINEEKFQEFFDKILTKRFTISRLQRILIHILLGITQDMTKEIKKDVPFVKILGFSDNGRKYLNFLKKEENYLDRKIIISSRNLKKYLSEEELKYYKLNELYSSIYRLKNNYDNIKYPIIYGRNL